MLVLIDMNLSPAWVTSLAAHGVVALHWSTVGDPRAPDTELMAWARANGYVVMTCDLDFSHLLAWTRADGPSVVLLRGPDVFPEELCAPVVEVLRCEGEALRAGAIATLNERGTRVRILPLS